MSTKYYPNNMRFARRLSDRPSMMALRRRERVLARGLHIVFDEAMTIPDHVYQSISAIIKANNQESNNE